MHRGKNKFKPGQRRPVADKEPRRTERTGWDELTPWYAGWAGGGHNFHKNFAFPALAPVLNLKRGMRLVDLGCGMGALREMAEKAGVEYVGVDKSPSMIREAKRAAEKVHSKAQFFVSDVARPGGIALPVRDTFDRATFLFSIQDVDNHRDAFKNAAKLLAPKGELVLFMVHPAFRIPRQSGWGTDEGRKLTYRRVDRYHTEATIPLPQRTGKGDVTSFFYHRPIESYVDALRSAGFLVADMKEVYSGAKGGDAEFPHFLLIRAVAQ